MNVALNPKFDHVYFNISKFYDSLNMVVIMQKRTRRFYYRIMPKKDTERNANSEDPD